jgi:hypothetical protein
LQACSNTVAPSRSAACSLKLSVTSRKSQQFLRPYRHLWAKSSEHEAACTDWMPPSTPATVENNFSAPEPADAVMTHKGSFQVN